MPQTLRLPCDDAGLAEAGRLLAAGRLVAFPTETVYGLGCDATNPDAVARLYAAKGRPAFNPLIAHAASLDDALGLGEFSPLARRLAKAFWPGPLTLVVPSRLEGAVCELARAGLASIAIRVPNSSEARAVIRAAACPIAAPSANRSGHVSPTSAAHVLADLEGLIDAVVMGPDAQVGVESSIVAMDGDEAVLLRAGGLDSDQIERILGRPLIRPARTSDAAPLAPGRLASHYAPRAPVRLNARSARPDEAVLDFCGQISSAGNRIDLSPSGNVTEAAGRLYAALRTLDASGPSAIAVALIPDHGLGEAINDRLRRAAAPR